MASHKTPDPLRPVLTHMAAPDAFDFSELASGDEVSIDAKGRIVISRELREAIKEPFVLGRGEVGCLVIYPKPRWDTLVTRVKKVDEFDPARQAFERMVIGGAEALKFDSAGRLAIPRDMRTFAKLESGKARVVGMTQRVEVWSSKEFDLYQADPEGYNKPRREAIERAYRQMMGQS